MFGFPNSILLEKNKPLILLFSDKYFKRQTEGPRVKVLINEFSKDVTGYKRNTGKRLICKK